MLAAVQAPAIGDLKNTSGVCLRVPNPSLMETGSHDHAPLVGSCSVWQVHMPSINLEKKLVNNFAVKRSNKNNPLKTYLVTYRCQLLIPKIEEPLMQMMPFYLRFLKWRKAESETGHLGKRTKQKHVSVLCSCEVVICIPS